MSLSVICHGCGRYLQVGDDYPHRKLRCPECGVICELPKTPEAPPQAKSLPRSSPEPPVADLSFAPEPRLELTPSVKAPAPEPPSSTPLIISCRKCGEVIHGSVNRRRRKGQCPNCGEPIPEEALAELTSRAANPADPRHLSTPKPQAQNEEEGLPYVFQDRDEKKCPQCKKALAENASVCAGCGFNLVTGKKPVRTYEPVTREWEAGLPYAKRLRLFLVTCGLALVLGMCGVIFGSADLIVFLFTWLIFVAMMAFLLGTFDRLNFSRSERGRIALTKTWRICFQLRPSETFRLSEFQGVATGLRRDVNLFDWLSLAFLMPFVVPGILWWYFFILRDSHYVALTKEHGYRDAVLYSGWKEEQAKDIAETIVKTTDLRFEMD